MNESLLQKKVLKTLWNARKPLKIHEIVEETSSGFSSLMTNLQRLVKMGYVSTPKRGFYAITERGRETIGISKVDNKRAAEILGSVSLERAFHFYKGINEYLGVYASSLNDFCRKIQVVDLSSIEFHLFRQDFESWVREELGDADLANTISLIRTMDVSGENLRKRLFETVESRCRELKALSHESSWEPLD